jgi:putative transposase
MIMPRKKLIRTDEFPYHISARSNNKDWFKLSLDRVWEITQRGLVYANKLNSVEIHAFVLMNNHYHLLVTTPNADIDRFMRTFNKYISEQINIYSGVINYKFGGPYNWSIVSKRQYLFNVYRYVFRNPVKAGVTQTCEEYPFSSLHLEVLKAPGLVNYRPHFDDGHIEWLEFFNRVKKQEDELIRRGLRRANFNPMLQSIVGESS